MTNKNKLEGLIIALTAKASKLNQSQHNLPTTALQEALMCAKMLHNMNGLLWSFAIKEASARYEITEQELLTYADEQERVKNDSKAS